MTPDRLEQIRARTEAATVGPWHHTWMSEKLKYVIGSDVETDYDYSRPLVGNSYDRQDAEFVAHARTDVPELLAEVERLTALTATCCCGTSPMTYEGPEPDCPVHGAVRAFNEATHDIAQLQAANDYLTAQPRQAKEERAAVALERDEAINDRENMPALLRRITDERDSALTDAVRLAAERDAERALRVEADDLLLSAIAEAEALKRQREELVVKRTDLLDVRGLLSPNGGGVSVLPAGMDIGERVAPAVEWLIGAYEAALPVAEAAKAWVGVLHRGETHPDNPRHWASDEDFALIAAVDEWQRTPGGRP